MRNDSRPKVIPTLRYREARSAIDWLCNAFGFERHLVVPGEGDTIAHAQLTCCGGMIMLGSALDDAFEKLQKPPIELAGTSTQSAYIVLEAVDAHYERAKAAGAEIVFDIVDQDYGGRGYSCRDPEGHLWHFGSYDPWQEAAP